MSDHRTEMHVVDVTAEDRARYVAERKEAHREIGKLAILKTRINQRIKGRTDAAEKVSAECSAIIRSGTHYVLCRVEIDRYENKARYTREDTGAFVRSRALTPDERQERLDFDAGPTPAPAASGKRAEETKPEAPPRSHEEIAAELMKIISKPLDVANGLIVKFGEAGANRVIDAINGGASAEEAFAAEETRQAEAPPPGPCSTGCGRTSMPWPAFLCSECDAKRVKANAEAQAGSSAPAAKGKKRGKGK